MGKRSKRKAIFSKNTFIYKRKYLARMNDNKVSCMDVARKYEKNYWDGKRKYGYGGYKFIEGYWTNIAKKLIENYDLKKKFKNFRYRL